MGHRDAAQRQWGEALAAAAPARAALREAVLEWLLSEGLLGAAERFRLEAGAGRGDGAQLAAARARNRVRAAVLAGDVEGALALTRALAPGLLEGDARLLFRLRRHMLVQLIARGEVAGAVAFAQQELAPLAGASPDLRKELEQVLALLIFDDPRASPLGFFFAEDQLRETAHMLNAALLVCQGEQPQARLGRVLQYAQWAQDRLAAGPAPAPCVVRADARSDAQREP